MCGIIVVILLAVAFPLLMNGQTFTNSIVGIACSLAAAGLIHRRSRDATATPGPGARRVLLVILILWAVMLTLSLPGNYEFQMLFNAKMAELRAIREGSAPSKQEDAESPRK
jgi:hypothetical protein